MMDLDALWYSERPGLPVTLARLALWPASVAWRAGTGLVSLSFRLGLRHAARVDGPLVVSVGNLAVGGSGKTPVAIFRAQWAQRSGRSVAVLSRGYGRSSRDVVDFSGEALPPVELTGDEPRLIARRAPGVRVVVGADRVATARQASASGANFLILDDGFQHRRLARDVDLVVVGGEGNGRLMPAGPLRESRAALTRAHLLWNPDPDAAGDAKTIVARHRISGVVGKGGAIEPPESLRGRSVVALAGIARPARFLASLESLGATVVERFLLPDHHAFSEPELARVREAAARHGAAVVTTEKDRERLPAGFEALAPRLGVEVVRGLDTLASVLGLPVGTALSASE
jgi:tetraacyldisaccharide 4'-kinase